MTASLETATVLIVGAGIMGTGIAQVAAQAGHPVMLFDAQPDAATAAKNKMASVFEKLVAKGKFNEETCAQTLSLIEPIESLDQAAGVGLVVEAIVEDIEIKRSLLQQIEGIVSEDCVLATNTSSLSVTAIANGMQHPERLVGMHFFNPAALMKLVEVVSGLQTSAAVAESIFNLAESWGKVVVYARSTPGFIVNRIARPFYAESLALLQEQAATPAELDSCLRAAGFRMGPGCKRHATPRTVRGHAFFQPGRIDETGRGRKRSPDFRCGGRINFQSCRILGQGCRVCPLHSRFYR